MDNQAVGMIISLGVCVVLPVAIVWIVFYANMKKNQMQTDIILEGLKSNPNLDIEKIMDSFRAQRLSPIEKVNRKLLRGSIFTLFGIAFAFTAAFCPDPDDAFDFWIICAVSASVGIGFLISYWFAYKNLDRLKEEYLDKK
ncbi:MAG: hypothetical protein J1E82_08285 [Muribaculaceae bacterium]|nr:hypothetical protein [Muribaculaceae bacterium]